MDSNEEALAIMELEKTEGWQILKERIESEEKSAMRELRRIELEGRSLESIGSDYIANIQRINGLNRVLEIVEEIKERYQQSNQ